jgi:molybdate transport system substrate-binding protein
MNHASPSTLRDVRKSRWRLGRACIGLGVWMVIVLLLTACASMPASVDPTEATAAEPATLTVSAAADLTYAFGEIGRQFEAETGHKVVFNFGSTGQLAQQIEQGAPVDLFAAANISFVEELERQGLILPDTKELYARGRITIWTRAASPLQITSIADLTRPEVQRIAIANPDHAPYGVAAREAMQTAGVWEAVQPKLVLGENVQQTLQYAETGNVDVAIVALSLSVPAAEGTPGRWTLIPQELHPPIDQALAVIKDTKHQAAARAFAAFVNGPQGRPIMRKYGFVLPGEEPAQ